MRLLSICALVHTILFGSQDSTLTFYQLLLKYLMMILFKFSVHVAHAFLPYILFEYLLYAMRTRFSDCCRLLLISSYQVNVHFLILWLNRVYLLIIRYLNPFCMQISNRWFWLFFPLCFYFFVKKKITHYHSHAHIPNIQNTIEKITSNFVHNGNVHRIMSSKHTVAIECDAWLFHFCISFSFQICCCCCRCCCDKILL